jgi:hypothetical protein
MNQKTGNLEILAVAARPFESFDRKILSVTGNTVSTLPDSGIIWTLDGVWFSPGRKYYVVGSGIYEKRWLSDPRWRNGPLDITTYYTNTVRGSALNNVFVAGAFGEMLHNNGHTWQSYKQQTGLVNGQYYSLAVCNTMIIAVGYEYPRAVVLHGRRE